MPSCGALLEASKLLQQITSLTLFLNLILKLRSTSLKKEVPHLILVIHFFKISELSLIG
ncbi:hypothetical protein AHAS_Ahas16G0314000 [Arachis hypogaea]